MRVTVEREPLLLIVKALAKVASTSVTGVDSLRGIHMKADEDDGTLQFSATNLAVSAKCMQKASVSEGGETVVPAILFRDILSLMGASQLEVRLESNILEIAGGKTHFEIAVLSAKSFPLLKISAPQKMIPVQSISELARKTIFAVSPDSDRPSLQCVKLAAGKGGFVAAACDGSRLIVAHEAGSSEEPLEFLLPSKSLRLIAGLCGPEKVLIGSDGRDIIFKQDWGLIISARPHMGSFLDAQQLLSSIQREYGAKLRVSSLLNILMNMHLIVENNGRVKICLEKDAVILQCSGTAGTSSVRLEAEVTQNLPPREFWYPVKNLMEDLRAFSGYVFLTFNDEGSMLIQAADKTVCLQNPTRSPKDETVKPKKASKSARAKAEKAA